MALALMASPVIAQSPAVRISAAEVSSSQLTVLQGSKHPLAQAQLDAGRVPADTKLSGVTIFFNRSAKQEAELQALLKAQQTPGSPQFHQWLTPEQFAARFGVADADLEKVQGWLERQGFAVDSINRGRNAIHFSGRVNSVEQAFATEMHYYNVGGVKHMAPSTALSVPTAIAPMVSGVLDLNDFKPLPMHIRGRNANAKHEYSFCGDSSCTTGNQGVFFAPGDIKIVYDINPLITAGNTGAGHTIAVMGQSQIATADITNFQDAAGLTEKLPTITLVPNSGASTVYSGDEGESDLDLEWSGAIATGATINFVYTGSTSLNGVFDSFQYAVDQSIGDIISISYGACETELTQAEFNSYEMLGEQAVGQGQTIVAASGDQGSTACSGYSNLTTAQQEALAVNYPASSVYATGVGGTEISPGNDVVGTYWASANTTSGISLTTALSYIPEIAWNDDSSQYGLSASGGGVSTLAARPAWQTGVTGITSGNYRLVPDIALYSSPNYPGYLYCTSDESDWGTQQLGSCGNSEFYDPNSFYFTVAGGTSFATPIFAGMVALLSEAKGYTTGQGLVNTELYSLAANSATYSTAFHDVTSGNNNCTAGSGYCSGSNVGFSAGTGYDLVTGLGSVDLNNLATAWTTSSTTTVGTTTTITPSNTAPLVNTSDTFTISVSANSGSTVPSGMVAVSIDGGASTNYTLTAGSAAATASFSYTFTTAGSHTVSAKFPGDTTFGTSTGTTTVNVQSSSSATGSFTMAFSPTTLTVSQGSQGNETLTVTPSKSPAYTGTIVLSFDTSNDSALQNLCVFSGTGISSSGTIAVTGSAAVSGTIVVDTNASDCVSPDAVAAHAARGMHVIRHAGKSSKTINKAGNGPLAGGLALAGLLIAGFLGISSKKLRGVACIIALAAIGMALTACGSTSSSSSIPNPAKGTYTITFTGEDSATATINATQSFTLTID